MTEPADNEPWRIELLGGLRLRRGEITLTRLETRKATALLACLALSTRRAHSRDRMAEQLWPDEDPEATRSRLRQALSSIRRALEPSAPGSVLLADRSEVRLDPAAVTTDVAEFEDFLRLADKAPDPAQRAQSLTRAVELYRGDLLAGFDEEWILAERERLRDAYISALCRLAVVLGENGNRDSAIGYVRRAVAADPLREPAHLELMRLYAAAGRTSEALRQYRDLERILKAELDTAPSAEAQALALHLQSRSVEHLPAAAPTMVTEDNAPAGALQADRVPAPAAQRHSPIPDPSRRRGRRALIAACALLLVLCASGLSLLMFRPARGPAFLGQGTVGAGALYGNGRDAWNKRTEAGFTRALGHFNEAIRRDPNYAPAWSGLADTYSLLAYYGYLPPNEAERKAKEAVEKALSINPNLVEARISRAWIAMTFDGDWIAAEDIFRDVLEKKPRYATAYQWYSFYLMARQRTQESLDLILEAQRLEPHPPVINKSVGQRYFHARQYAQAVERFEEALNLEPGSSMILYWLGLGYEQQALQAKRAGRHPEARARFEQARQTFEDARNATVAEAGGAARKARPDPAILAALGHLHAVSGNPTQARRILRDLERLRAERYVSPVAVAILNAGLGDRAAAIRNLKTAHAQRSPELTLLKIEPRFEPLRAEPEFRQLLSKVFPD